MDRKAFFALDLFMKQFNTSISIARVKATREKLRSFHDNGDYTAEIKHRRCSSSV